MPVRRRAAAARTTPTTRRTTAPVALPTAVLVVLTTVLTALLALVAVAGVTTVTGAAASGAPAPSAVVGSHDRALSAIAVSHRSRATRLTASPGVLLSGETVTVRGRITPGPRPVIVQQRGDSGWQPVRRLATNKGGRFRVEAVLTTSVTWYVDLRALAPRARVRGRVQPRVRTAVVSVVVQVPETDAPSTTAPTTSAPTTSAPTTSAPTTSTPTTSTPTTSTPTTSTPTTSAPTTPSTPTDVVTPTLPPDDEYAEMEARVLELTNIERAAAGCPPLVHDARLAAAARGHSTDMADQNYFSHTSLDGRTMRSRVEAAGCTGWRAIGENIAAGYPTPEAVVDGWMTSDGHRRNILNCGYTELGVGVARNPASEWGIYWTQNFGDRF